MFLRNTEKTDQLHRHNTKSACRRVGPLLLGPNFGVSCCVRIHLVLKLEIALLSEILAAESILTRSKTPKQNEHGHCIIVLLWTIQSVF